MYVKLRDNVTEEMFDMVTYGTHSNILKSKMLCKANKITASFEEDGVVVVFRNNKNIIEGNIIELYQYDNEDFDKIFEKIKGDD